MQTTHRRWRSAALLLLMTLIIPILVACGSGATPTATQGGSGQTNPTAGSTQPTAETTQPTAETTQPTADTGAGAGDVSKYLVYGNPGEPDSLDSMNTTSGQALVVTEQMQESLVGRTADSELAPMLAESWEKNADATEWTFKLREGVMFHDGTPFNAEAVVFNFQRMGDPENEFAFRAEGKTYAIFADIFGGDLGAEGSAMTSVEAVDEYTVKFTMARPFPLLPDVLSSSYFGISSPDAVKKDGANYGTPQGTPVGTGAFKFQSWTPGQNIILVRNEDYWGEKAAMPGAVVRFIADAPARLAELQAGSIDFTVNLPPDAREVLTGDLTEVPVEPFNTAYVAFNINDKPFDDPRVRQAITYGINRQEILDSLYGGVGSVATDHLPDALGWARSSNIEPYEYNVEKAKSLLAEAGYPEGIKTMTVDGAEVPIEFWYMPVSRPYYPTPEPVAQLIQAQLSDIGIEVELKTEDWGVYLDNVDAGKKHGMWMLGWTGDYADPNNFLYVFFGPTAKQQQGYDNPELISLLEQAGEAPSQEESAKLFAQANEIINKDMVRIPIVHAPPVYGARTAVQGWVPSPFGHEPWAPISVQK